MVVRDYDSLMSNVIIAIPTYYGGQLIGNCIQSILKNVTNPEIMVYKNDVGWLKACNKMIQDTQDDIILLNDDTLVLTDIAYEMHKLAYSDKSIGVVGAKALAPNGETIINYGITIAVDGNSAHRFFGQPKDSVGVEKQKAVEGSCMYIKREVIDSIGLFDEVYGMGYRAEVDYCFRAREAGYKIVSCPTAEYTHLVSQTAGRLGIENDTHKIFMDAWGSSLRLGRI